MNGMKNKLRRLSGRVDINYYDDDSGDTAVVKCNPPQQCLGYANRILNNYLPAIKKTAFLNGATVGGDNCNLDSGYCLCGDGSDSETVIGCCGIAVTDSDGYCRTEDGGGLRAQNVTVEFSWEREISNVIISGDTLRGEYPETYVVTLYDEKGALVKEIDVSGSGAKIEKTVTVIETEGAADYLRSDIVISFEPVMAKRMQLSVIKWSAGNTVVKISYFSSERIERCLGEKLKSLSIVEEKTGDTDKLSYGISSNSLSFEFLNENKRFYFDKDYGLLRKNRRIYPYIRCGVGEMSKPLGVFFSDEWKIRDGDPFVSCKAYDVLYPLQELKINYGCASIKMRRRQATDPITVCSSRRIRTKR